MVEYKCYIYPAAGADSSSLLSSSCERSRWYAACPWWLPSGRKSVWLSLTRRRSGPVLLPLAFVGATLTISYPSTIAWRYKATAACSRKQSVHIENNVNHIRVSLYCSDGPKGNSPWRCCFLNTGGSKKYWTDFGNFHKFHIFLPSVG